MDNGSLQLLWRLNEAATLLKHPARVLNGSLHDSVEGALAVLPRVDSSIDTNAPSAGSDLEPLSSIQSGKGSCQDDGNGGTTHSEGMEDMGCNSYRVRSVETQTEDEGTVAIDADELEKWFACDDPLPADQCEGCDTMRLQVAFLDQKLELRVDAEAKAAEEEAARVAEEEAAAAKKAAEEEAARLAEEAAAAAKKAAEEQTARVPEEEAAAAKKAAENEAARSAGVIPPFPTLRPFDKVDDDEPVHGESEDVANDRAAVGVSGVGFGHGQANVKDERL